MAETKHQERPNSVTITRRADDVLVTLNYSGGRLSRFFDDYEEALAYATAQRDAHGLRPVKFRGGAEGAEHAA